VIIVQTHSVFCQLTLLNMFCSFKTTVFPDKAFPDIPWQKANSLTFP